MLAIVIISKEPDRNKTISLTGEILDIKNCLVPMQMETENEFHALIKGRDSVCTTYGLEPIKNYILVESKYLNMYI